VLTTLDGTAVGAFLQAGAPKPRPRPALLPQPDVLLPGASRPQPLDDALGIGWAVVARGTVAPRGDARTFVLGRDLDDPNGTLEDWLARRGARWALVRPDRHVAELG
jgi:hypothetical protein